MPSFKGQLLKLHSNCCGACCSRTQGNEEPGSPLSSLPQLPLHASMTCLSRADIVSLTRVCRGLSASVGEVSRPTVKVTPSTRLEGLRKVLPKRTMACNALSIYNDTLTPQPEPAGCISLPSRRSKDAVDVLLKPSKALSYQFPGIKGLNIYVQAHARPLYGLLPVRLAALLPDLKFLHVLYRPGMFADDADMQPIPYCSTLTRVSLNTPGDTLELPSRYHTSEDLRPQLPKIDTLVINMSSPPFSRISADQTNSCISTLFEAWAGQLTQLVLPNGTAPVHLQQSIHLQILYVDQIQPYAASLPWSLTSLRLGREISEIDFHTILKLPLLHELAAREFSHDRLQQDWSNHPCSLKYLNIRKMSMVDIPKLPLHSLDRLEIWVLVLPDALLPNSFNDVVHAADCVRTANIAIEGFWKWECNLWDWVPAMMQPEVDIASARLLRAASRVVQPCSTFLVAEPYRYNGTVMLEWLSPQIQDLTTLHFNEFQPWFWQALCCCSKLERVSTRLGTDWFVETVSFMVLQASRHLVAATRRPVTLVIKNESSDRILDATGLPMLFEVPQTTVSQLITKLQKELPASVRLQKCDRGAPTEVVIMIAPA